MPSLGVFALHITIEIAQDSKRRNDCCYYMKPKMRIATHCCIQCLAQDAIICLLLWLAFQAVHRVTL